jgi:acyl-CoA dehydrogenase
MEAQRLSTPGAQVLTTVTGAHTARARVAAEAAAQHAPSVDAAARFPAEAFAEIRNQRLLGLMVPASLGGEGATIAEIADVCFILGQACSSTALIFAMHQIKIACLLRHSKGSVALERILRQIATEQLLMASSTTEGQAGGNVRSSDAAIEHVGEDVTLERKATVIS